MTGASGASWECTNASGFEKEVKEVVQGDVFGLAKRTSVPFSLPRGKTSIKALLARVK